MTLDASGRWRSAKSAINPCLPLGDAGTGARGMDRRSLVIIVSIALSLRLGFALWLGSRVIQPDEGVYLTMARNIYENHVIGFGHEPSTSRPPALPVLMATAYEVFGPRVWVARVINALLGLMVVLLTWRYGAALFGEASGLLAAAVAAVHPFLSYWSGVVMTETLAACLVVAALWRTQQLIVAPSGRRSFSAGVLWGLAVLTRTQNIGFVLPLAVAIPVLLIRESGAYAAGRCAGVFAASALALPCFWVVRNKTATGFFAFDSHAGYTMVIRTMFHDQDRIDTGVAQAALAKTALYKKAMSLPPARRDRFFARAAMCYIAEHPGLYVEDSWDNFIQFWRFYPRADKIVGVDDEYLRLPRRLFILVSLATEPALIVFAAVGLWLGLREKVSVILPALFIAFTTAVHTLIIAQMRYRIPIMPLVIILASAAAVRARERWETSRTTLKG